MAQDFTKEGNDALEKQIKSADSPSALFEVLATHLAEHRPTEAQAAAAAPLNVTSRPVPQRMQGDAKFCQVAYRVNDRLEIYAETPREFEEKLKEARQQGWVW
jgi:hypothetical protein